MTDQRSPRLTAEDFKNAQDVTCDECGSKVFKNVFHIKRISPLVAPNGQEGFIPVPTFCCAKCGHINEVFLQD
jgi:hypothetical protein